MGQITFTEAQQDIVELAVQTLLTPFGNNLQ